LTACFAVSRTPYGEETWASLAAAGIVRDRPGDRESFLAAMRDPRIYTDITGPTSAWRAAQAVRNLGLALPAAAKRDPFARDAERRLSAGDGPTSAT
jgi:hypothetical protein